MAKKSNTAAGTGGVTSNAPLPQFFSNMDIPATNPNFWTTGADGNPQFNVPHFWPNFQAPNLPPGQTTPPVIPPILDPRHHGKGPKMHGQMQGQGQDALSSIISTPAFANWFASMGNMWGNK